MLHESIGGAVQFDRWRGVDHTGSALYRAAASEAEIHYITKKAFLPVLEGNPHIDKIITIESSVSEKKAELQAERYDVVIDLHRNVRTLRLKRALGVKSYAFPKRNIEKFLLTNFKINRMPDVHVVDRYFEAVKQIGVKNDGLPCELFLSPADEVNLSDNNLQSKQFVAVAMGAQFATKQLPVHLMAEILSGIELPVVLLGGPTDVERADQLKTTLPSQQVIDFCGKITLRQSAFVVSQSKAILTGDTGLMHIASAFSIPIVSVWGNTVPALGMYPYAPQDRSLFSIHEVNHLSCRPCSKIGYKECPKKHFKCMELQDGEAIQGDLLGRV